MCLCPKQKKDKLGVFNTINKQPVRLNMTFPKPGVISRQIVVTIFFGKCLTCRQSINYLFQKFQFTSSLRKDEYRLYLSGWAFIS